MTTEQTTIKIINKPYFDAKLQALQTKFKKLGVTPPTVIDCNSYKDDVWIDNRKMSIWFYDITIEYEVFSIKGYTFVSKLDLEREMFYTIPNVALPDNQKHFDGNCEHCNINRQRNNIFVLRKDDDNTYKRVGSSCLAKYIGVDASVILSMAGNYDIFTELLADDEMRRYPDKPDYNLSFVLSIAKHIAQDIGFVSVKQSREDEKISTATVVRNILDKLPYGPFEYRVSGVEQYVNDIIADTEIFAQYTDYVNGCIEWMKGQATGNNVSEYALNLAKLAERGTVIDREVAFAVSALGGYNKALDSKPKVQGQSINYGNIGDKFTAKAPLIVTCIALSTEQSKTIQMGRMWRELSYQYYTFEDSNGNIFVTYTESGKVKRNDKLSITGTIKGHSDFNGTKQTVLERCRFTVLES